MTPEQWKRIEALYEAAAGLSEEARRTVLSQAEPSVRQQVEAMLAQAEPSNLLSHKAWDVQPLSPAEDGLRPGVPIGQYIVEGVIGEGGMGIVYRAQDTKLHRPVAIKFLSNELADAAARRRFQREAQTASALNHPHIVTVYDVGEFEGQQYLVTEFVDGGTLKSWARREARGWEDITELLTGVADGLASAHDAGVLHRDIKPDNILVTLSGYAKLADFGLAKLAEDGNLDLTRTLTEGRTRPGTIVGTIPYMSPEQAAGKPVDARSDIFSFGVVLYELLEGQRPFRGDTDLQVLQAILHADPHPLTPSLPASVRRLVERALAKDPSHRYQSMRDLVAELKRCGRATSSGDAIAKAGDRSSLSWRKWAFAGALVMAVAAIAWIMWRQLAQSSAKHIEYVQLTNFADSAVAPSLSPDGRMLAFIRGENTFEGPGQVYVKLLPDGEPVQLTHDSGVKEGPVSFSPDGSQLAFTDSGSAGDAWVAPVLGGEPNRLLGHASALSWVESTAGRPRVMFSSFTGTGIHMGIFESTASRSEIRTVYMPSPVTGMAHRSFLSPDRRNVLVIEMDLGSWLPCRVVPFDGSSPGTRVGPQPAQCTDAAWSPDGKWMYLAANTGDGYHIWRQRFPDGKPEQITSGATEEQGISFAADGRSFVTSVGTSQNTLWVKDAGGDRQITSEGFAFLPTFSRDGRTLYYLVRSSASRRFVSGELWSVNLETGHRSRLLPDFLMEHYDVSEDGKRIVFLGIDAAGRSQLWIASLDGSWQPRRLSSSDYSARALFDPHGGVLFVAGEKGVSYVYHVNEDGTELRKLLSAPVSYLYAISPDGKAFSVWIGLDVVVAAYDGSSQTMVCKGCATAGEENRGVTPALVRWSPDQKFLYVHDVAQRETYAIPLRQGQLLPTLPEGGLTHFSDANKLPGAITLPVPRAFAGASPEIYAYPKAATHRNIYRIPVP